MSQADHKLYAEGAAIAHGASTEIADLVSDTARDRFKKAFHETLVSWLVNSDQEDRNWVRLALNKVASCLERGASPEEARAEIEHAARRLGYL